MRKFCFLLTAGILLAACGSGGGSAGPSDVTVMLTPSGIERVAVQDITPAAAFSGGVTAPSDWGAVFHLTQDGGDGTNLCPASSITFADNIATCTPASPLSLCAEYTISVSGLTDAQGGAIAAAEGAFKAAGLRGDFNGDGYADAMTGNMMNNSEAGQAFIFFGSEKNVVNQIADVTMNGAAANDLFGTTLSTHGDFNGDCIADAIVGAPYSPGQTKGADKAYIFFGSTSPLASPSADVTLAGSDNDGFGWALSAGDFNGDGYDDAIVGAKDASSNAGKAFIYYGGAEMDATADVTWDGGSYEQLGCSVAGGDFNSDGYDDAAVGAAGVSREYIFYGSANGPGAAANVQLGFTSASSFGTSSAVGDINGDGFDDLIVGANESDNALVFFGSQEGISSTAGATLSGTSGTMFGFTATAGDINGDGFDDAVVGEGWLNNNARHAYVFFGAEGGVDTTADVTIPGDNASAQVSSGDFNADGFGDLLTMYYVSELEEYLTVYRGSASISGTPAPDKSFQAWANAVSAGSSP